MECISCIKDGNTGVCRDIKDKQARELIEGLKTALSVLQDTVAAMSGVDGGHLATDTDIQGLQGQINGINEILEEVATDTELDTIQKQIDNINSQLAVLDNTYAKDTDIQGLQSQINNLDTTYAKDTDIQGLQSQINSLDNTYAKDTDIQTLQTQITNLQTLVNGLSGNVDGLATTEELNEVINSLNEVINTINALDNTYATDSDIQGLQSQINSLDSTYAKDTDIQGLSSRITTLENAEPPASGMKKVTETITDLTALYNKLSELDTNGQFYYLELTPSKSITVSSTYYYLFTTGTSTTGTSDMTILTSGVKKLYYPTHKTTTMGTTYYLQSNSEDYLTIGSFMGVNVNAYRQYLNVETIMATSVVMYKGNSAITTNITDGTIALKLHYFE